MRFGGGGCDDVVGANGENAKVSSSQQVEIQTIEMNINENIRTRSKQ